MTKKLIAFSAWWLLAACNPPASLAPSLGIAGTYRFTEYNTAVKSDMAPVGQVTVTAVDDEHVNLTVQGTSGKAKIVYAYANVSVLRAERNYLGDDTYSLFYRKHQIGMINSDEQGHYISLTLKPYVTLVAALPAEED